MGAGSVLREAESAADSASSLTSSPEVSCFVVPSYKLPPKVRTSAGGRRRGSQAGAHGEDRAHRGVFDAVPFTPSQGVRSPSPSHAAVTWNKMYSPFTAAFQGNGVATDSPRALRAKISSDGGSAPDGMPQHVAAGSPMHGMPQYSPFMLYPMGPPIPGYLQAEATGSPMAMPGSPMSPGVVFHPSPFAHGASMGAPGSPHAFFSTPFSAGSGAQPYPMGLVTEGSYPGAHMPPPRQGHYYPPNGNAALAQMQQQQQQQQGGMAHMPSNGAGGAFANPYAQAAYLQAYGHQGSPLAPQMGHLGHHHHHHHMGSNLGLETQFSAPAALHARRTATGHMAASHQLLQQQNSAAALGGHMGQQGAAAAMAAAAAAAAASHVAPVAQLSRLRVAHSADYSMLEQQLQSVGSAPRRFKARKNSEPKIGPDGQPRLNARQRRTLRRAKERALKGLLEVSQALLQKADVNVQMPNMSALTALEEAAEKADADYAEAEAEYEEERTGRAAAVAGGGSSGSSSARASPLPNAMTVTKARQEQLSAAVAAAEDAAAKIAAAAVAAVAAHAAGQDTSNAAAAAQAAAAQAVSAVAIPDIPSPNTVLAAAAAAASSGSTGRPPLIPVRAAVAGAAVAPTSPSPDLDAIDIGGLIAQLSRKKDEGMVDEKLIRDLQIIQSLIGALRAPLPNASSLTSPLPSPLPSGTAPSLSTVQSGGSAVDALGASANALGATAVGLGATAAGANGAAAIAASMAAMTLSGKPLPKRSFSYSPGMAATSLANFN